MNVLLGFLTFSNVVAFFVVGSALGSAVDHGDDEFTRLLQVSLLINVIALVALGGAWATRKWGPRLYLGAVLVDRLVALIALEGSFPPVAAVGIVLAILLLRISERDW